MITVLIVDDHPVGRDGLAAVLATQPDLRVVGQAATGAAALREVAANRLGVPDRTAAVATAIDNHIVRLG